MSLNENIKKRREELKLSQEYVAEQLGVSRQAVSKWETGASEPNASNLAELAALLEINLSELVGAKNEPLQENSAKTPKEKDPDFILHTNLSLLAISVQAGMLYSCTQPIYVTADGVKSPDYRFMLVKLALLFLCSVWMSRNLFYEKDLNQRKKNSQIELLYCFVQLVIALCTYYFKLGLIGLTLITAVLFFYILYINPKYMNRPFGKKQSKE